jgi:hypothetical protein
MRPSGALHPAVEAADALKSRTVYNEERPPPVTQTRSHVAGGALPDREVEARIMAMPELLDQIEDNRAHPERRRPRPDDEP